MNIDGASRELVAQLARWWECVGADITKEGTPNWIQTSRNINEWKNAIEKAKVHLGI